MPEKIENRAVFSLHEISQSIGKMIEKHYVNFYWIKAEMNKLNHYTRSGHCYPDLVEKEDGKVKAQMRAVLWKDDFARINSNFLKVLKEPLKEGIKILFLASISYDPIYGLTLRITDIDPSFTLGDLEREKHDTLIKLKSEGVFFLNKQVPMPLLPQRIALISVETSRGYADFINVLDNNPWGYSFFRMLFPSLLQGERAVPELIAQLKRIRKVAHHFDLVAIIRGGGGDVGLSCYNNYELAKEIALFPLPVLTGIGHATNETVAEMVAFENSITPTKLAESLLQRFHNVAVPLREAAVKIPELATQMLNKCKGDYNTTLRFFKSTTANKLSWLHREIDSLKHDLRSGSTVITKHALKNIIGQASVTKNNVMRFLNHETQKTDNLESHVRMLHPDNVLKRGYSISLYNGKALKSAQKVKKGETIVSILYEGQLTSIIQSKKTRDD